MACCAFAAFLIGQCLALAEGWRRRFARLLHPGRAVPAPAAPRLPWKKGLIAALVLELGFGAGCAIAAWATLPSGTSLPWCLASAQPLNPLSPR